MDVIDLRIVILQIDAGLWCDYGDALSAQRVTYVAELPNDGPTEVCSLTYCETCDDR